MSEFEKKFGIIGKRETVDEGLQKKITTAEERLGILAQVVGADFGMKVRFGQLGGGNFFDPENNSVTLDPQILLEDKEFEAEFIAGHEGGHRAITRSLEQIGVSREKAIELYKKIGFGYLENCLEDCADNDWVGGAFAKFKESSDRVYAGQFEKENVPMTTPEINKIIAQLGYVPKFVSFGSEIIRQWATGRHSWKLDEFVEKAFRETENEAQRYWQKIPGTYSGEGERLKSAKERSRIFFEKIWPEAEKLVKMDIDQEKMRQLADEMNKKSGEGGESGSLPPELQKELSEKAEQNLREQLERMSEELEKLKKQMEKADNQEEKDRIAGQMSEMLGEKESLEKGEKNIVPWDKLSEELKKKIQEIFDKLPKEAKEKLEKSAREELEKLDDALIKEARGKLAEDVNPPTHEEIRTEEEKKSEENKEERERTEMRQKKEVENRKIAESLRQKIKGELGEYEKTYQEIAPLADELFNRIHKIFLPQRHPKWQKGHPTGQRLDLAKVMQFQSDRGLYDKLWERKSIPHRIDYRFTLLVDLSGSMQGEKIQQTFRGVILLAEVLNRLGIKTQILGFQDDIIAYKDFREELTAEIRKKITMMPKEVSNKGEHNKAKWNSDGYCLEKSSELLEKQKGKDNFLVILSDGEPAPDPEHQGEDYDLHKVVADIRKKTKQKLIGVGLGQGTKHVGKFYPTSLPNLNIQQLPKLLGDLLEDMISYPAKYR